MKYSPGKRPRIVRSLVRALAGVVNKGLPRCPYCGRGIAGTEGHILLNGKRYHAECVDRVLQNLLLRR